MYVFGLFIIYCNKSIQPDCDKKTKDLVFYSWKPLSPEVSTSSPYTHAQHHMRTSRTFCTFAVTRQPKPLNNPSLVENLMSRGRRDKFWIVSSRLLPYSNFSKHSRKSHTVAFNVNESREESTHTRISDLHLQRKIDK